MPSNKTKASGTNEKALKHLFDAALLRRLAKSLKAADSSIDARRIVALQRNLQALEMKPRIHLIRDELKKVLPEDYAKALPILRRSTVDGTLKDFDLWPYAEFIQTYGLGDFEISLEALKELTLHFTSEWAVRPFLKTRPRETVAFLCDCAEHAETNIRRWASEGSRPRLPWGERLHDFIRDPSPTLPILEKLKFDDELFVRKSVANHLNDIAKDHPDLVIKVLRRWKMAAPPEQVDKINWITKRSLRTLIKNGNTQALELIGVSQKMKIRFGAMKLSPRRIQLGQDLQFSFDIQSLSKQPQKLVVDYILHFVKANRSRNAKVFKLKTLQLPPGAKVSIRKRHPLKKITTRVYHSGLHRLEIQINGVVLGRQDWILKV